MDMLRLVVKKVKKEEFKKKKKKDDELELIKFLLVNIYVFLFMDVFDYIIMIFEELVVCFDSVVIYFC